MLGLAFLPAPLGWLAWVGFVPLLAALARLLAVQAPLRRFFTVGYLYGFVFYLFGFHWLPRLSPAAMTVPVLRYPAWLAGAAYLALFAALSTTLTAWLVRRARFPLAFAFPLAFLALEELRASGELGFPWFQIGYTQHAFLPLVQLASLGSVSLVTLWLYGLNVLAFHASRREPGRGRVALAAALCLALPWLWGSRVLRSAAPAEGPVVALVQGNVSAEIKWTPRFQEEIFARFLELSRRAAERAPRPALLVWPETATGTYLMKQPTQREALSEFLSGRRVSLFTGYPDYVRQPDGRLLFFNAAGLLDARGRLAAQYAKRHLVPFGERMPFQRWIPALGRLELGQAEWAAGQGVVLFQGPGGPFSCLVCFEAIFPDLAREDVRRGARWLVNITNDAWFGNSAALYQHAAMAVFRAVENHVTLVRCANTGLSLIVDPWGRVRVRLPVFAPAVGAAMIPPPGPATWFTRLGDWPALLTLMALAWAALRALTGRGARG